MMDETEKYSVKDVVPAPGRKYDKGKNLYNLIPPHALDEVVKVLTFGAVKYNEPIDQENWRLVSNPEQRYFAAAQRHLWAMNLSIQNQEFRIMHTLLPAFYFFSNWS